MTDEPMHPDPREPSSAGDRDDDDRTPDDDRELSPLEGMMDPENGVNSPASDADAPAPG